MTRTNLDYNPMSVWFEFSEQDQEHPWKQSERLSHTAFRQSDYLNQLVQQTVIPYLQESFPDLKVEESLDNLVYFGISGVAIALGSSRLVILPSEQIDLDELEIPQEWVESNFAADIFMGAQVDLQAGTLRLWGYTTLEMVSKFADRSDFACSYRIDAEYLTERMQSLWLQLTFFPEKMKQLHPQPSHSSSFSLAGLMDLMDTVVGADHPRQTIAHDDWMALMNNGNWRQQLIERIQAKSSPYIEQQSLSTKLSHWFEHHLGDSWQPIQQIIQPKFLGSFMDNRIKQAKLVDLGLEFGSRKFALMMTLERQADVYSIQASLFPAEEQTHLPAELKLRILTEAGELFKEVTARVDDEFIRYKFDAALGDRFLIQVASGESMVEEAFQV